MTVTTPGAPFDPAEAAPGDVTRFWRVTRHGGLGCLRATFRRYAYTPHTHETYAVAAILSGCETFYHRGAQRYAGPGAIAVVCPDEVHDGEPYGGGFEYRTLYPGAGLMQEIAEDIAGRPLPGPPHFRHSVVEDPELSAALARLHDSLAEDGQPVTRMEQDARLVAFLAALIARWSGGGAARTGREPAAIARAIDYLDAHAAQEVELADLSRLTGLSRSHVIRAFRRETGLTPHAYLMDRRVRAAARLLGAGEAPGAVAAACGFFDQSHLNRVFKARMGVTPGAYRA